MRKLCRLRLLNARKTCPTPIKVWVPCQRRSPATSLARCGPTKLFRDAQRFGWASILPKEKHDAPISQGKCPTVSMESSKQGFGSEEMRPAQSSHISYTWVPKLQARTPVQERPTRGRALGVMSPRPWPTITHGSTKQPKRGERRGGGSGVWGAEVCGVLRPWTRQQPGVGDKACGFDEA